MHTARSTVSPPGERVNAAYAVLAAGVGLVAYAYAAYPALLAILAAVRRARPPAAPAEWPEVTIMVPAYNEERSIANALNRILEIDYPPDRRHVLVVSDASTDRTDEIVQSFAPRGVKLVRLPVRGGKTAAENAAREHLKGTIVVSADASVGLHHRSLKPLITVFQDPTVGVASGRDVSVGHEVDDANVGESGYVGYEMWVRDLETAAGGIVGASGCYYASRAELHTKIVPEALSRDFAAPLIAREHGFRSVSVPDALCFVPRSASLRQEYRRKVRTMSRGLQTLYYKRHLLNPLRYGRFAWMLVSHKLARWLVPWAVLAGAVCSVLLSLDIAALVVPTALVLGGVVGCAIVAWARPEAHLPRVVAFVAFVAWGLTAGLHAWVNALRGDLTPTWEPTRRDAL